jgi:hypothetical protein
MIAVSRMLLGKQYGEARMFFIAGCAKRHDNDTTRDHRQWERSDGHRASHRADAGFMDQRDSHFFGPSGMP